MILSLLLIFPTYYQPRYLCVWVVLKTFHCFLLLCWMISHCHYIYIYGVGEYYSSCRILLEPEQMIGHSCLVQFWHEWLSHLSKWRSVDIFLWFICPLDPHISCIINASLLEGLDKFNSMFREIVSFGYLKTKLLNPLQVWHFDIAFYCLLSLGYPKFRVLIWLLLHWYPNVCIYGDSNLLLIQLRDGVYQLKLDKLIHNHTLGSERFYIPSGSRNGLRFLTSSGISSSLGFFRYSNSLLECLLLHDFQ